MPYPDVPKFMAQLRSVESIGNLALEFCMLTATRSGETLNATWREIDMQKAIWTIPAGRMKAGRAHCVPLSKAATNLLKRLKAARQGDYVFTGRQPDGFRSSSGTGARRQPIIRVRSRKQPSLTRWVTRPNAPTTEVMRWRSAGR